MSNVDHSYRNAIAPSREKGKAKADSIIALSTVFGVIVMVLAIIVFGPAMLTVTLAAIAQ